MNTLLRFTKHPSLTAIVALVLSGCAADRYAIPPASAVVDGAEPAAAFCAADWSEEYYDPAIGRVTDMVVVNDGGWCRFHLYRVVGGKSDTGRMPYYGRVIEAPPGGGELRIFVNGSATAIEYRPRPDFFGRDTFAVRLYPGGGIFRTSVSVVPAREAARNLPEYVVYFDFDLATLRADARTRLDELAATLARHQRLKVALEGHTDGLGSDPYNDALALRRASSVRDYLVRIKGISADRIMLSSYGKRRLAVPDKPVADENRRVRIRLIDPLRDVRWSPQ